jgi:OOP family OmpA-OmpF porin
VNFHHDSDELTEESLAILDGVAATLLNHPDLPLKVAGHTDSSGDDEFNMDLSQRRAASVRAYLVSKGVDAGHLTAHGYGEERPVASNADSAGRAANRRVELIRLDQ